MPSGGDPTRRMVSTDVPEKSILAITPVMPALAV